MRMNQIRHDLHKRYQPKKKPDATKKKKYNKNYYILKTKWN